jgi:hypothetical protein
MWLEVLMLILFLIGGFHFDHLYKWHVTPDITLCMITKFMNKWMFTLCKAFIIFYWTYTNI